MCGHPYPVERIQFALKTGLDGKTAAVVTVERSRVRAVGTHEITHTRELSTTSR